MSCDLVKIEACHRVASFLREAGKTLKNIDREGTIELLWLAYQYEICAADIAGTNPVTEHDRQRFLVEVKEIRQEIEMLQSAEAV